MDICITSTGKHLDLDQIKFDIIARDKSKGAYHIIFVDDTEIYLTVAEYEEVGARARRTSEACQTERLFPLLNQRRLALLEKRGRGFTPEESRRPFTTPGWSEEYQRRIRDNLTDQEHAELSELRQWLDEYFHATHPRDPGLRQQLDAIEERLRITNNGNPP